MKRANWPVTEKSVRPNGPPDRCFYCDVAIGGDHRDDCVMRRKTVVVRVTVDLVVTVPDSWDGGEIEFHCNEGSSCSNNVINDLADMADRIGDCGDCTCNMLEVKYQREATAKDEMEQYLFVKDCES